MQLRERERERKIEREKIKRVDSINAVSQYYLASSVNESQYI